MKRFFNTAGPCVPGEHYLLSSADRLHEVAGLIDMDAGTYYVKVSAWEPGGPGSCTIRVTH